MSYEPPSIGEIMWQCAGEPIVDKLNTVIALLQEIIDKLEKP